MGKLTQEFITFAKEKYGYDISLCPSQKPDTFQSVFGTSFLDEDSEQSAVQYNLDKDSYSVATWQLDLSVNWDENYWETSEELDKAA